MAFSSDELRPKAYADLTGKIIGYNRAFLRLCERDGKEIKDANLTDLAKHESVAAVLESSYSLDQVASSESGTWTEDLLTSASADDKEIEMYGETDTYQIIAYFSDMIISGSHVLEAVIRPKNSLSPTLRGHMTAAASKKDAKEIKPKHATRLDVLVVDDSNTQLKMMKRMIEDWGHDVVTAGDGIDALEQLKIQSFDIVLMDVNMPHMNGLEAAHKFREIEKERRATMGDNRYQKIVALSSDVNNTIFMECTNAGVDVFIPKPLTESKFLEVASMKVCL